MNNTPYYAGSNGHVDTQAVLEEFKTQGPCGFSVRGLAEFSECTTTVAQELITKISEHLYQDDQGYYIWIGYRTENGDNPDGIWV